MARAETDSETKETVELDPKALGTLLQHDAAPAQADLPTTTIERETLRDLLDLTVDPPRAQPAHHAHTVPRDHVRRRDEGLEDDLDAQLSPLVVIGVLGLLLVVFIAVSHLH